MAVAHQILPEPPLNSIERVRVANCPVDRLNFEQAAEELCRRIEADVPTHVVFVNAAKVVKYARDSSLQSAMDNATLLLADGVPVVWAARLLGTPLPGRVNGTDLMERMVALAADRGYSVYFLGATEEVISQAVAAFRRCHPALKVAGFHHGYVNRANSAQVIQEINRSGAQILLVGMGTPQKELWGEQSRSALRVPICQGVGGSFDVIAGVVKRAPRWMQRSGLEWFYRLVQEPRRLLWRYVETNTIFTWMVVRQMIKDWKLQLTLDRA
jgi:N-acetylglucosaminyldiphosphoundecaprenol N-acetyl-beta-D-mannosaminyltransferase